MTPLLLQKHPQHLSTSAPQHLSTSAPQHLSTSAPQHLSTCQNYFDSELMYTKNVFSLGNLAADAVFALLESLPEQTVLIDPNGTILSANTLFASRFDISLEECIGASAYELITTLLQLPEHAIYYREKIAEVLRTGKQMVFENGTEYLNRKITINPVLSPEGKVTRLLITIADISVQKRMTTRFSQALDAAHAGVWEWDLITFEADLNVEYRVCNPDGSTRWLKRNLSG